MSGLAGSRAPVWRSLAIASLLAAVFASAMDVSSLPKPTGYVSDFAHVLNPNRKQALEEFCTKVDQDLGVQFALVTIDTLDDRPIRDAALEIARKWGVGSKAGNQGVLLLLAVRDHKSDIETGRGIEPYITDGFAGSTLRSMRTQLMQGDYGGALSTAAEAMAAQIAQGKGIAFTNGTPAEKSAPQSGPQDRAGRVPVGLIIFGIIFLIALFGRGRRGGRGYGGGGGFWIGMLLGNLLGGGRGGPSDWGRGGFGGGSGGGGGFGGFGGGDFGGGGASSSW